MHEHTKKPIIAISMGDPAGISGEIICMSLEAALMRCRPIVFGHWPSFERAVKRVAPPVKIALVDNPQAPQGSAVAMIHCGPNGDPIHSPGLQSAVAQYAALERSVDAVLGGDCTALVTGPIAKNRVAEISPGFRGHTEYLAARSGLLADDVTMIFSSKTIAVGLMSTHLPLRAVADAISWPRFERTVRHLMTLLSLRGNRSRPSIAVAALNPHAGEGGLIGTEEEEILNPFCRKIAAQVDADITLPLPADMVFRDAFQGRYDAVVSVYHDQAMIPLKLGGIGQTVNVTMGLPFIRTSPDHGVAYDIVGTGNADPAGMRAAIDLAADLSAPRPAG
ncbi:MAG: 4-hydroxythreonine-4-phosphate dehydrogenase PdxA [Myxococcota bacterium]|nr:4-hydroxythreonine-4-phosphate dehydrogenase PdxA [Myxococcota bacterium]